MLIVFSLLHHVTCLFVVCFSCRELVLQLRQADREAKVNKRAIYHDFGTSTSNSDLVNLGNSMSNLTVNNAAASPSANNSNSSNTGNKVLVGTVTEVLSGDTIIITTEDNKEVRVSLASIK